MRVVSSHHLDGLFEGEIGSPSQVKMDLRLRAPLHEGCGGDGTSSNNNSTGLWWEKSHSTSTFNSKLYETIICCHLCRMYIASNVMELGNESTFTGLVLFHRYVRKFYCSMHQNETLQQTSRETMKHISSHLGTVAAACLFLGCKMEEEPRRIRDVINLSHILKFSLGDIDENATNETENEESCLDTQNIKTRLKPITILELPQPPLLDENYWAAKDQMVATEQHVLRMLQFDTSVCHPHRCILIIMELMGFGKGKYQLEGGGGVDQQNWLLGPDQSEEIIRRSWSILSNAPLDGRGQALQYPVILLSCAAIELAAEASSNDKYESSRYEGGKLEILPEFWWRVFNVSNEDIVMAKDALQKCLGV